MSFDGAGEREVEMLRQAILGCRLCRDRPLGGEERRLPHEPRPVVQMSAKARILIAGQAPGKRVHETGIPFNDPSGERLRDWLGVDRQAFYDPARFAIIPMGFCFPGYDSKGYDLPPRRECAPHWRARVMALLPQVELVIAIGQHAQKYHLGKRAKAAMTQTVQHWRHYLEPMEGGPPVLPLPHPSWRNSGWLKRHPWFEAELLPVLKKEVDRLGT
ncbi:uracil-DNA glycosylase family protein [Rhizobium paknamense]|uniref:Uracil-DNA glycosylase n=1 Tax=Rhizobium paknamense TaxID=1206817 RepID=A0ABU0I8W0_9HYPH|nr:uracil-DNA glycosylase family protein [Rhizobium paknamense]MDQ0453890.1 uracil-DNA glycosylase [Rhizobium paknamense]